MATAIASNRASNASIGRKTSLPVRAATQAHRSNRNVELDRALTGCPVMHFHSGPPMHLLSGVDSMRWILDFRPGVMGGRTAYRASGELRKVGLLPAALLATHRVEAPARPGLAFRSATPRDREVMTGSNGAFLSPPCARGGSGDKNPLHPPQADLLSEPGD